MPGRDLFLLLVTAFQILVKRVGGGGGGGGESTSSSSTSIGSLVFSSLPSLTSSTDIGSAGVAGDSNGNGDDNGDGNSDGDGDGNGTGIVFCLFFATFTFLFAFFLGGCKIAEAGID